MEIATYVVVFAAGIVVGLVGALFLAHRLDGPAPAAAAVRGVGRAAAPSRAVPDAEPIVPTLSLATLPQPVHVSDVQIIPGRSGWGRPSWDHMNVQFAQPLVPDDPEPPLLPDEQRPDGDGGADVQPPRQRDGGQTTIWARGALTVQAASLARRLGRLFRDDEHEGWEHGHMHELRGSHRSGEVAVPNPDHRPAHSTDGDTERLNPAAVSRGTGRAS